MTINFRPFPDPYGPLIDIFGYVAVDKYHYIGKTDNGIHIYWNKINDEQFCVDEYGIQYECWVVPDGKETRYFLPVAAHHKRK